jgi:hypothetical protein
MVCDMKLQQQIHNHWHDAELPHRGNILAMQLQHNLCAVTAVTAVAHVSKVGYPDVPHGTVHAALGFSCRRLLQRHALLAALGPLKFMLAA